MNTLLFSMTGLLRTAAIVQLAVAGLNLGLERILGWRDELERMPLLLREVVRVHVWFISITLATFGVLTWRFAPDMASKTSLICRWLTGSIGLFWGVRTILQVTYYSSSHWRGHPTRTCIHVLLLILYGGLAFVYLGAALF